MIICNYMYLYTEYIIECKDAVRVILLALCVFPPNASEPENISIPGFIFTTVKQCGYGSELEIHACVDPEFFSREGVRELF